MTDLTTAAIKSNFKVEIFPIIETGLMWNSTKFRRCKIKFEGSVMEGCYIIAEMAVHDGDVDKAKIIVDAAIAASRRYTTPNLATPKFSSARS